MELRKETKNFLKEISNFAIKNTGSSTSASETRGYIILLFFIHLLCSFEYEKFEILVRYFFDAVRKCASNRQQSCL